jgi:hypothetical protein
MRTAFLSVFAPAVAIFAGALLQQTLIWSWPGVQSYTIAHVSVDSYVGAVAVGLFSFLVGIRIWRRAPAHRAALLLGLVPVVWLLVLLLNTYRPPLGAGAPSAIYLFSAAAPLLGIALALAWPSNHRLERP